MRGRTHPGVARRMTGLLPHTTEAKITPKFLLRWLIELSTISNGSTDLPLNCIGLSVTAVTPRPNDRCKTLLPPGSAATA